jgi:membrane protein DedA with SNARE-associated domain
MLIKKKAHTLTIFSVLWTPFTIFGVWTLFHPWSVKDGFALRMGGGFLLIQFLLITLAIWCWIKEKKREARVFRSEFDIGGGDCGD